MSNIRIISQSEDRDLNSTIVGKCQNSKINKFIEDINKKAYQRDIVLLLIDIAEKPEICIDYNISISYYLALYLRCKEEPVLSEAGCLILNAAKIYARRVDNVHNSIENTLVSFENVCKTANKHKDTSQIEINTTKPKRINKRTLPQNDYLQEYELCVKKFKLSTDEKLYEKEITLGNFEPPKRHFSDLKKYKEWQTNKRKLKSNENMTESFIDPSLWKYSSIEDFDYEDDIDTKRNYQVYTNIIEHRYSTLKNDINFVMHFKVKDFVEAEEEVDTIKELSPLWKNSKNLSDNIKNYIEIENTIIENECTNCDPDLVTLDLIRRRRKRNNNENLQLQNINTLSTETTVQSTDISDLNNVTDDITSGTPNTTINNTSIENNNTSIENNNTSIENNNTSSENNNTSFENNNTSIENSIPQLDTTVPDSHLNLNNDKTSVCNSNLNDTILSDNVENNNSNSENFNPATVIVRLSLEDEGVFFSDLDEVDRAMLNPRVIATDITSSMQNDIKDITKLTVTVDEKLGNFFGIDESQKVVEYLNLDNISKNIEIKLNFLKLPEKILRKKYCVFRLTSEFNLFKMDRLKRKRCVNERPPRCLKLFKLNKNLKNVRNLSYSPQHEPDFMGFDDDDMCRTKYTNSDIERIKNCFEKFRSVSLDSGIAIPETLTNRISLDNITPSTPNNISADNSMGGNKPENNLNVISNLLSSTLIGSDGESAIFNNSETISEIVDNSLNNIEKIPHDSSNLVSNDNPILKENHVQVNDMLKKIQLWHRHLKPILAQSKTRHHFDVFELGTEIINHFPKENTLQCNNNVTFKTIMNNKDPSFISRYFLSMLLLANTNNISINIASENIEQPSDTDNIQLKLLSRKRHTVSVEDNIGMPNSKRICSSHESVLFPKPNKKIMINNKSNKMNDDNDSGFYSELSLGTSVS